MWQWLRSRHQLRLRSRLRTRLPLPRLQARLRLPRLQARLRLPWLRSPLRLPWLRSRLRLRLGRLLPLLWLRFIGYIPWLLFQILKANLHVMYLVFHPRMRELIDPQIIEFDSKLSSDVARTTFANSITLTPGTITVDVTAIGQYKVHCIDAESGKPLPGEMEAKIAQIFME